ncbi:TPA: hypothetical protein HA278_03010 [Candidatus Woesearchaeota archaeon]|nr:hypothetical protein [Candidatus Woesearchaeota archaeon]
MGYFYLISKPLGPATLHRRPEHLTLLTSHKNLSHFAQRVRKVYESTFSPAIPNGSVERMVELLAGKPQFEELPFNPVFVGKQEHERYVSFTNYGASLYVLSMRINGQREHRLVQGPHAHCVAHELEQKIDGMLERAFSCDGFVESFSNITKYTMVTQDCTAVTLTSRRRVETKVI